MSLPRTGAIILAFCLSGAALALEVADIALLAQNGVADSVIINMLQSQGLPRPPTPGEVIQLNAAGVSPEVLEYLTRTGTAAAANPPLAVAPPPPVTVQPPQIYYQPPSPQYVYTPTYIVPRPRPRFFFDFSFGGGRHHHRHHGPGPWHGPRRR
ncbi:MAG: hypothetical protein LBU64_00280 [Planctomycetota bacterium]|nr:hypothetical protein [Planctomycetota bacterium]